MEDTIPVQDIAADNCLLFLWATFPNLAVVLAPIIVVLATAQTGPDRKPAADQPGVTQTATIAAPATWDAHEPTYAPEAPQEARETPEPEF